MVFRVVMAAIEMLEIAMAGYDSKNNATEPPPQLSGPKFKLYKGCILQKWPPGRTEHCRSVSAFQAVKAVRQIAKSSRKQHKKAEMITQGARCCGSRGEIMLGI